MNKKAAISVIIPVLNEGKRLRILLEQLIHLAPYEIIIVDGGSTDNTVHIASGFREVKVLFSNRGRSLQMNTGAREATGDILLFLHADSSLPDTAFSNIIEALELPHVVGGSFYLKFDHSNFWLNLYSRISRINHCLFTYGDQGLFVFRDHFNALGGFKKMQLLEDLELQKRIRKNGRFFKLSVPIITSARRFRQNGIIWQQIKNIAIVGLYLAGVPASRLAKYY